MKKLLFALTVFAMSLSAVHAQVNLKPLTSDQTSHKAGLDTTSNTTGVSQLLQIGGYQDLITIQSGVTKLTGSPTGSVKLYGSVDGVKYDFATTATDTLAVANVAGLQVKTWVIMPSKFQYYKTVYKPLGSQTSTITSTAMWRSK